MTSNMSSSDQTDSMTSTEEIEGSPEEFLASLGRRVIERVTWHSSEQIDANALDLAKGWTGAAYERQVSADLERARELVRANGDGIDAEVMA